MRRPKWNRIPDKREIGTFPGTECRGDGRRSFANKPRKPVKTRSSFFPRPFVPTWKPAKGLRERVAARSMREEANGNSGELFFSLFSSFFFLSFLRSTRNIRISRTGVEVLRGRTRARLNVLARLSLSLSPVDHRPPF